MDRRAFIGTLAGSLLAAPLAAEAQQRGKVPRIGYMGLVSAASHASRVEAFRAGLRDLGYIEGKTILIEFRWAESVYDRLPALAAELVRLNVDVLVTHGSAGALAAKQATSTIPIVITAVADILALGLVSSLSRPGANVTGLTFFNPDIAAKRLELLKEFAPSLSKAAILLNPNNPSNVLIIQGLETTAKVLKGQLQRFEVKAPSELDRAFTAMAQQHIGAVMIHEDTMLIANAKAIADLAAKQRLPACGSPEFPAAGGLMAYGVNFPDMDRRAATFVDKVLKGVKPSELPVERSTRFMLIINLKTAKALGLTIPQSLLQRADQVIE
jgi:putative ABC transport system substrate-binding protein